MRRPLYLPIAAAAIGTAAQKVSFVTPPGQPTHKGNPGAFELIGNTIVSAQQIFLGRPDKVYILDKVENNPTQINGHPALSDNSQRAMDVVTNSFCAGGGSLGNGTWINVGGNQAVAFGGTPASVQDGSAGPYRDADGRKSRLSPYAYYSMITPCDDDSCQWSLSPFESDQRWYPTLETLDDGSIIILGGCRNGGYVNDAGQAVPTYEFFPPTGPPVVSPILQNSLPANLYPLAFLLPSGKVLLQANWLTTLLDYKNKVETPLDDMPDAVRTYPASAGTVMLPLTPANNWTATIMFCGGANVPAEQWSAPDFVVTQHEASASCVKLTPDVSKSYVQDDPLPERRTMTNLILLPDGKVLCLNGARMGTAGYGNTSWSIGQSYGEDPHMTPVLYDPTSPAGHRWSNQGFAPSSVPRMYHSSALLLPDGSVFVSGSNPNADYTVGPDIKYPTEYRTERFYPSYYNQRRPQPKGLISQLSYGGQPFDVALDSQDLFGDVRNIQNTTIVVLRTGFSTHNMNMGQRMVLLEASYTGYQNNTATLHVSQLPPNPAILAPGPAMLFVVVKGVPSVGVPVMVGSGSIGPQPILPIGFTPPSTIIQNETTDSVNGGSGTTSKTKTSSAGAGYRNALYALGDWLPGWISLFALLAVMI
ncbi:hypothetical protein NLJ89_g3581 [Agrocybe chaxingu]|uniref:Copper radical oxidase n=1 Tax=Agrocybe chaxingu TaxID=84603 RepID=A0A9W8K9R4_9AGAR|nr:hypothetical protein NLJ89_g3581 [Agrocybe chaxingu]